MVHLILYFNEFHKKFSLCGTQARASVTPLSPIIHWRSFCRCRSPCSRWPWCRSRTAEDADRPCLCRDSGCHVRSTNYTACTLSAGCPRPLGNASRECTQWMCSLRRKNIQSVHDWTRWKCSLKEQLHTTLQRNKYTNCKMNIEMKSRW